MVEDDGSQVPRLFDPGPGVLCDGCFLRPVCGAADTVYACSPSWGADALGGEHVLHPAKLDTKEFFEHVDGADFGTVAATDVLVPPLPAYLPQVRGNAGLKGFLDERIYAVRAGVVIRENTVLPASDLRRNLALRADTRLVLLLFDRDPVLERVFQRAAGVLPQLAAAAYDLVVAPSYSCWWPRPRADHLYNLKRSLRVFQAFQSYGIPAIPRIGWAMMPDAERFAEWVNANPSVKTVGLDFMTYRPHEWWAHQIECLRHFDRTTGQRIQYLVNGPSVGTRFEDLYRSVDSDRVFVTNAAIARPPRDGASDRPTRSVGERYIEHLARDRQALRAAAREVWREREDDAGHAA